MTCTDRLAAGVIAALSAPAARLYEIKAAFGVVIVCVALATTIEVMMATTVAKRITNHREDFWIIAFILYVGFLCAAVCVKTPPKGKFNRVPREARENHR